MKKPSEKKFQKWSSAIMDEFDFNKVHKTMKLLNWEWRDIGVPDITEIRRNARYILNTAYKSESGYCSTGGFESKVTKHGISLKFIIAEWDTY